MVGRPYLKLALVDMSVFHVFYFNTMLELTSSMSVAARFD